MEHALSHNPGEVDDNAADGAGLQPRGRAKRVVFTLAMLVALTAMVEVASALVYFLAIPADRREIVEVALGFRDAEFNNVERYRPHPYFNYVGSPDYLSPDGTPMHHPMGFRATDVDVLAESPDSLRIVSLGGSTTFGLHVDDPRMVWPELVGLGVRETFGRDVEVINAGMPNYTTYELMGVASMWLPEFHPDIVLVHTGLNDAFTVGFPDEGGPDNRSFRYSWSYRELPWTIRTAMRSSYLARVLGTGWLSRSGHQVGDMTPFIQYDIPPDDEVARNASAATGKYFRRNLETLIALIRHAGAEPVLVNMPISPRFENTAHLYYGAVAQAVLRNNRIMAEVGERHRVTVVDLYAQMQDPDVYTDTVHVDRSGMAQKAQLVFDAIRPMVAEMLAGEGES